MRAKAIFTAMLLALAPLPSVAQDFNTGLTAYQSGDYAAALREWEPLAEQGFVEAQTNLGAMYYRGQGVLQDYSEGLRWFRAAAEQGGARAQVNLGRMYREGKGVSQNDTEAVRWYRAAAVQGNAQAQRRLGGSYAFGWGVAQDFVLAHMWVNIAAANGNDIASELREDLAKLMTSTDISEAQRRARVCMASNYQDCE